MQLFNFYHRHDLGRLVHSNFWRFELSLWLQVLGKSLIAVFIPVLMLRMGFTLPTVILYYVLFNLIDVPLNFIAAYCIKKIGARLVTIIGMVSLLAYFVVFYLLDPVYWPLLILLAFFEALYDAFYWVGHVYIFLETSDKTVDAGKNTGLIYIIKQLGSILGPALGALILLFFKQNVLLLVCGILLSLSIVPLFLMKHFNDKPAEPLPGIRVFFKNLRERRDYMAVGLNGMHGMAESMLWPLFIFVVFGTIQSVAFLPMIVSITALFFSYFTGRIHEAHRESAIMVGAFIVSLIWIARIYVDSGLFYYISVFFIGLLSLLVSIPVDSNIFTRAKTVGSLSVATYRNTVSMFAQFVFCVILAVVTLVFKVGFLVAAASMAGLFVISYVTLLYRGKSSRQIQMLQKTAP